jgi:hypothetical protein
MPSGFFLKKKPPCTPLNTARVLEKCSKGVACTDLQRALWKYLLCAGKTASARLLAVMQELCQTCHAARTL